jgi:hypothetical protein
MLQAMHWNDRPAHCQLARIVSKPDDVARSRYQQKSYQLPAVLAGPSWRVTIIFATDARGEKMHAQVREARILQELKGPFWH